MALTLSWSSPVPSADHAEPFQRAMWLNGAPPAAVKYPPMMMSPSEVAAREMTMSSVPPPKVLQLVPLKRLMNPPGSSQVLTTMSPLGRTQQSYAAQTMPPPMPDHA